MMLLCVVSVLWAAVVDFKKRITPDWIWIAVLLVSSVSAFLFNSLYIPLLERILVLLLLGVSLLLAFEFIIFIMDAVFAAFRKGQRKWTVFRILI